MSRTKKIILIIILLLLGLGIFGYFYMNKKNAGTTGDTTNNPNFFPFGPGNQNGTAGNTTTGDNTTPGTDTTTGTTTGARKRLFQISHNPTAGFGITLFSRPLPNQDQIIAQNKKNKTNLPLNETVAAVRYVEKFNGNIFETVADTLEEKRLSNTTIPRIVEAYFTDNGSNVIMRYLDTDETTIQTYLATVPTLGSNGEVSALSLQGKTLSENISELAVSPSSNNFFYLVPFGAKIAGVVADSTGGNKNIITNTSFHSWLPQWMSDNTIILNTKATAYMPGYAYSLDAGNGTMAKIFGGIPGLMLVASPDGNYAVYSKSINNGTKLYLYNANTGESTDSGLSTLADKCAWSVGSDAVYCAAPLSLPNGAYPDDWYQGIMNFSDTFWKIDPKGETINYELFKPQSLGAGETDGTHLSIDPNDKYLFYINKRDGMLWKYDLR